MPGASPKPPANARYRVRAPGNASLLQLAGEDVQPRRQRTTGFVRTEDRVERRSLGPQRPSWLRLTAGGASCTLHPTHARTQLRLNRPPFDADSRAAGD